MKDHIPLGLGPYDSDPENDFLVEHDCYIRTVARKLFPSELFPEDMFELEVNELAQTIRIKLWKAHQKRTINNPRAYIRKIASTAVVDIVRHRKPTVSLSTDMNGELNLGYFQLAQNVRFLQDPVYEVELGEIDPSLLTKLVEAMLYLPPRQKLAALCAIKEHQNEVPALINALKKMGLNIDVTNCPNEGHEIHLLKASLYVARKKLQGLLKELMAD
jgi:DNA-directed RNA polymerase specialized sigma24 family protein